MTDRPRKIEASRWLSQPVVQAALFKKGVQDYLGYIRRRGERADATRSDKVRRAVVEYRLTVPPTKSLSELARDFEMTRGAVMEQEMRVYGEITTNSSREE